MVDASVCMDGCMDVRMIHFNGKLFILACCPPTTHIQMAPLRRQVQTLTDAVARHKATSDSILAERNRTVASLRSELQQTGSKQREMESELSTAHAQLDVMAKADRDAAEARHDMVQLQGQLESLSRNTNIQTAHRQALEDANERLSAEREALQRSVVLLTEDRLRAGEEMAELRAKLAELSQLRERAAEEARAHERVAKEAREQGDKDMDALRARIKAAAAEKAARDKQCAELELKLTNLAASQKQADSEQAALTDVLRNEVGAAGDEWA